MHDSGPLCLRVPDLEPVEHTAIKACLSGSADSAQAHMAMEVIVQKLCCTHDLTFIPGPGGDRDTAFLSGRQYVGYTLLSFMKRPMPTTEKSDAT